MVSLYWGGPPMIGRYWCRALRRGLKAGSALAFCAIAAANTGSSGSMLGADTQRCATILAVGLFNSIMFQPSSV